MRREQEVQKLLVSFEGIDASGKTTTAVCLAEALHSRGIPVVHMNKQTPEVSSDYARDHLRALADRLWRTSANAPIHELGELHWIHLNAAYYSALWESAVRPAAASGNVVIVDSWINKFVTRVSSNGHRDLREVMLILREVPQPDMVFLLDVSPATAAGRRRSFNQLERGTLNTVDGDFVEYQSGVRERLLTLAGRSGWSIVEPGGRAAPAVAAEIADLVTHYLHETRTGLMRSYP